MSIQRYLNDDAQTVLASAMAIDATTLVLANTTLWPTDGQTTIRIDDEKMVLSGATGPTYSVLRAQEGSIAAAHAKGAAVVPVLTAGSLEVLRNSYVTPEMFGAVEGGTVDCSLAFQKACTYVHASGGGKVYVRPGRWLLSYPVYVRDNTELCGAGVSTVIVYRDPTYTKGRGGFVIGSSLEANRDTALAAYADGTYASGATTLNSSFVNPTIGQYLRDNPSFVQASKSSIHDMYLIADFTSPTDWGGYGVNIVNAVDCHAYNLWGEGWTQLVGMGSDVAPETPSNDRCSAYNLHVVKPDPVRSYYAIGFIANSTRCSISGSRQYSKCSDTDTNGSSLATNFCEDCDFEYNVVDEVGLLAGSSQGILINNSRGCVANGNVIKKARQAIATFSDTPGSEDASKPNVIHGNTAIECGVAMNLGGKDHRWSDNQAVRCDYDMRFENLDATGHLIDGQVKTILFPGDQASYLYLDNNTIGGWTKRDIYLRPMPLLLNPDPADLVDWNANKSVRAAAGKTLQFVWEVPRDVRAVRRAHVFITYADNAAAAGSTFDLQVRRMPFNTGNTAETPIVEVAVADTATSATTEDKLIETAAGLILLDKTPAQPITQLDIYAKLAAATQYSTVKEFRIEVYA